MQQQKQFNNKIDFDAIVKVSRESSNENPHFSLPETFHNALSFRNYDNHGFSSSITNLLDTFIVQSEHNNGHSHQRIPRGGHFDLTSPITERKRVQLRKNTPRDFPMIVRQAIATQESTFGKYYHQPSQHRENLYMQESQSHQQQMQQQQDDQSNTSDYQSLPPPPAITNTNEIIPETPSIENAPASIDFSSAVNTNLSNSLHNNDTDNENNEVNTTTTTTTTSDINLNFKNFKRNERMTFLKRCSESSGISSIQDDNDYDVEKNSETFFNNINAMQLDDYDDTDDDEHNFSNEEHKYGDKEFDVMNQSFNNLDLNDVNSNLSSSASIKNGDEDDDEQVFREFNSHQYWYISPDIPVDMDILLEPEEKSTKFHSSK